jgi:hypothetical protein
LRIKADKMRKYCSANIILIIMLSGFTGILYLYPEPASAYTPHDPIFIEGNDDFAAQAASEGWPGNGTKGDPYIIKGYEIENNVSECIGIRYTSVHFNISGSLIKNGGISLFEVANGTIYNCTLESFSYGIYLNSHLISLVGFSL